jgi:hypothetical protein
MAMADDKQNPLESNSSADSNESSKVPGAVDVKQTSQESGSTEPGKAPGSADADQDLGEDVLQHSPKYLFDLRKSLGNITLVVGDNQSVTFNDYRGIVQGKIAMPPGGSADDGASNKTPGGTGELISENLKFERQSTTFFTGSESKDGATKPPGTEEEFSQWYYGLDEYEQYYVQTAAVLHGAPAHEVSKRADSFYKLIREQVERRESSLRAESQPGNQREAQQRDSSRFTDPLLRRIPSRELRLRTHTITRRVNGVERLYWRDVDQYGLSTFGLQLLDFLSTEFISRGEHGQISLDVLKQWSEESSNEVSWKAAHSYGVVLWCHDADLLGQIAENWAKVRSFRSRRRTAELLDGAYEIDRVKNEEKVDGERTPSIVLRLLDEWVDRVHADFSVENMNGATNVAINLGCAVASTYGLIGKRWPEIALNGLEHLLQFPQSESNDDTRIIFAAGVSSYVTLTWSGRIRIVLEHLAASAEQLSLRRSLPRKSEERQKYRRQREVRLNATFEAFFLIAAAALPEIRDNHTASYSLTEPLPPHPAIPDPDGRDVLLAGLLSAVDVRESLTTLLCAAIVEKKSRPAFGLLRFWAEAVLELRGTQDREAEEIYLSFRQFIVNLGITVARWCLDLEQQGFRSPQAVDVYKNRLEQWCIEGRYLSAPIASLAQEVLNQLGS